MPVSTTTVGLDTATPDVAVAVVRGQDLLAERSIPPEAGGRPRAATALLPALEEVVGLAGGWAQVDLIGVGVGPGSFTGLRIGVATARALAQGAGTPIAAVGTLAALARGGTQIAGSRAVLALVDARRGEGFAALFSAAGEELWPPFVAPPEEICDRVAELGERPVAVGDGSVRFRMQLEAIGVEVPGEADAVHTLSAGHVAWLAAEAEPTRPEAIEPIYLRRPDAELWRERVGKSGPDGG
jgi:tRNA threonylcarbamoyladenosine biosynthesis protein TsaB